MANDADMIQVPVTLYRNGVPYTRMQWKRRPKKPNPVGNPEFQKQSKGNKEDTAKPVVTPAGVKAYKKKQSEVNSSTSSGQVPKPTTNAFDYQHFLALSKDKEQAIEYAKQFLTWRQDSWLPRNWFRCAMVARKRYIKISGGKSNEIDNK